MAYPPTMRKGTRTVFRLCACGCGENVDPYIHPKTGRVEGYPRYISGHGTQAWAIRQREEYASGARVQGRTLPLKSRRRHVSRGKFIYWVVKISANPSIWQYEHRLVAEEMLGRKLLTHEDAHHINKDTLDNRPENIEVMTKDQHQKHHHMLPTGIWARLYESCIVCGERSRKHASAGQCTRCYQRDVAAKAGH